MKRFVKLATCLIFFLSLDFIRAEEAKPVVDWMHKQGDPAVKSRAEWVQATKDGKNLVLGLPVTFSQPPTYHLTTDEHDRLDLTTGKLSQRTDDRIWFSKDAVGYADLGGSLLMLVDLGKVEPISRFAIRLLGGKEQGPLGYPREIEAVVSEDGVHFYKAAGLIKLNPAESTLADNISRFYIPEEGVAATRAFVLNTKTKGRYVGFRVSPYMATFFCDQIAVIRGDFDVSTVSFKDETPLPILRDAVIAMPRHLPLVITANIITPNWFTIEDTREKRTKEEKIELVVDLPSGIAPVDTAKGVWRQEKSTEGRSRWLYSHLSGSLFPMLDGHPMPLLGPFYFSVRDLAETVGKELEVRTTVLVDGKPQPTQKAKLQCIEVPNVPLFKSLSISLTWMTEDLPAAWPEFLKSYKTAGFNGYPVFPRNYRKQGSDWSEETQKHIEFALEAKKQGLHIVLNSSPWGEGLDAFKDNDEVFNVINGKRGKHISLLHRGAYYQHTLGRIREACLLYHPTYIFWDIESAKESASEGKGDPALMEAFKKSGKDWENFLTDIGVDILDDLRRTVLDGKGDATDYAPRIGLYAFGPKFPLFDAIFDWKKDYPKLVNFAMPSLYNGGDILGTRKTLREEYQSMNARTSVPWLTTGTGGSFEPRLLEPIILETVLNGAEGIAYFCFTDFDGVHFYYQARALAMLSPFDDVIGKGSLLQVDGDNTQVTYTAWGTSDVALILIGNYAGKTEQSVTIRLDKVPDGVATDLRTGKPVNVAKKEIKLRVPARDFVLLSVTKTPNPSADKSSQKK